MMYNALRGMTSLMAVPGCMFVGAGLGLLDFPADIRMPEKVATVGLEYGTPLAQALLLAIGLGKVFLPFNNFIFGSRSIMALYAALAFPGFGIVLYSHRMLPDPDPWVKEVSVILAPFMLLGVYLLAPASKAKGA
jgi:hypothetical protein